MTYAKRHPLTLKARRDINAKHKLSKSFVRLLARMVHYV